jgi:tetratricopeptide (TPR) repeat protein
MIFPGNGWASSEPEALFMKASLANWEIDQPCSEVKEFFMSPDYSTYNMILQKLQSFRTVEESINFLAEQRPNLDQEFLDYVLNSGFSYSEQKDYEVALLLFNWGVLIATVRQDPISSLICKYFVGQTAEIAGQYDLMEESYAGLVEGFHSLDAHQQRNNKLFGIYASVALRLADLFLEKGDPEIARSLFSKLRDIAVTNQSPNAELAALINLVNLTSQQEDIPSARRYISLTLKSLEAPVDEQDPYGLSAVEPAAIASILFNAGLKLYFAAKGEEELEELDPIARRVIEFNPENMQGYYLLSLSLLKQGRSAEAVPVIEKSIQLMPTMAALHLNLSGALIGLGEYDKALKALDRAIAINPQDSRYYHNRAVIHHERHNLAAAIEDYTRVIELLEQDVGEHTDQHEYGKDTSFEDAILRSHMMRLKAYIENQTPAAEIPDLEWFCNYDDPGIQSVGLFYKGKLMASSGNFLGARSLFSEALAKNPGNTEARLARITTYQQTSQSLDAFEDIGILVEDDDDGLKAAYSLLEEILKQDPKQALAHKLIGRAYFRFFGYLRADTHFREALKLLPNDHQLHYWTGMNLIAGDDLFADIESEPHIERAEQEEWVRNFSIKRVLEGIDEVIQALKLSPGRPEYLFFLRSVIDRLSGEFVAFTLVLSQHHEFLSSVFPDIAEASGQYMMGENSSNLRNFDQAIEHFLKAQQILEGLEFHAFARRINLNLADAYLRKGQLQTAQQYAKMAHQALYEVMRPLTQDFSRSVEEIQASATDNFRDGSALFQLEFGLFTASMAQFPLLLSPLLDSEIMHRMGRHSEAFEQIHEVEDQLLTSYKHLGLTFQTIISIVVIYRDAGQAEKALELLNRFDTKELAEEDRISLEITRGGIYHRQRNIKQALEHYLKADEIIIKKGMDFKTGQSYVLKSNLANIYALAGEDQMALDLLEKLEEQSLGFSARDQIQLKFNKAIAQSGLREDSRALDSIREAIGLLETLRLSLRDPDTKMSWVEQYLRVYDMAIELSLRCGLLEDALNYVEQSRSRSFTDLLSIGHLPLSEPGRQIENREAKLEQVKDLLDDIFESYNSTSRPGFVDVENIRKLESIGNIGDFSDHLKMYDEDGQLSLQKLMHSRDAVEHEIDRLADLKDAIKLDAAENVSGRPATFADLKALLDTELEHL